MREFKSRPVGGFLASGLLILCSGLKLRLLPECGSDLVGVLITIRQAEPSFGHVGEGNSCFALSKRIRDL